MRNKRLRNRIIELLLIKDMTADEIREHLAVLDKHGTTIKQLSGILHGEPFIKKRQEYVIYCNNHSVNMAVWGVNDEYKGKYI